MHECTIRTVLLKGRPSKRGAINERSNQHMSADFLERIFAPLVEHRDGGSDMNQFVKITLLKFNLVSV